MYFIFYWILLKLKKDFAVCILIYLFSMKGELLFRTGLTQTMTSYKLHGIFQFSHSVMSNPLRPHGLQHTRPSCPSSIPGIYSNSCPLSRWCHPTISSSVIPFYACPQSFPASISFPVSLFFGSGGQSIGVSSALASVLPMNIQD